MKKFLLTLAAGAAVLAAMPAAAQSYGGGYPARPAPAPAQAPRYDGGPTYNRGDDNRGGDYRGNDNRGDGRGDYRGNDDRGGWGQGQAINARQNELQRRIDMGVRRGALNRMAVRDL